MRYICLQYFCVFLRETESHCHTGWSARVWSCLTRASNSWDLLFIKLKHCHSFFFCLNISFWKNYCVLIYISYILGPSADYMNIVPILQVVNKSDWSFKFYILRKHLIFLLIKTIVKWKFQTLNLIHGKNFLRAVALGSF